MLQKISDRIQGWVAGIIIAIIAGVFALWGIEYYIDRGGNKTKPVATVNGKKISDKQLKALSRQLQQRAQAARPNKPLSLQEQKQIQSLALQQLVTKLALVLAAEKHGFRVSQQQVQQIVLQVPEFQVKGLFSPQRFQQFLFAMQMTEPQFLAQIRGSFLTNQVALGLEVSAFVLPNELNRAYQLIYQKRSFGYFTLPLSRFLKTVHVTDKDIQKYYDKNKASYKTSEKVKMDYLLLSPDAIQKTIHVSLSDLKAYYETNKAAFTTLKKVKSFAAVKNDIRQRIVRQRAQQIFSQKSDVLSNLTYTNPSTLTVAAKKLGLKIQTSAWFTKDGLKKGVFSNHAAVVVAFSDDVLHDKNNSNPVDLPKGDVLVMRINTYQPSKVQSIGKVKQSIRRVLMKNKAESKAGLQAYQISSALGHDTSPQVLAKRYALQWISKAFVQRNSKATPMPILASVFSTAPVKGKTRSGVNTLVLANGDYIILKVMSASLANVNNAPAGQLKKLQQELMKLNGSLDYRLYGKSVIDRSKIKTLNK